MTVISDEFARNQRVLTEEGFSTGSQEKQFLDKTSYVCVFFETIPIVRQGGSVRPVVLVRIERLHDVLLAASRCLDVAGRCRRWISKSRGNGLSGGR